MAERQPNAIWRHRTLGSLYKLLAIMRSTQRRSTAMASYESTFQRQSDCIIPKCSERLLIGRWNDFPLLFSGFCLDKNFEQAKCHANLILSSNFGRSLRQAKTGQAFQANDTCHTLPSLSCSVEEKTNSILTNWITLLSLDSIFLKPPTNDWLPNVQYEPVKTNWNIATNPLLLNSYNLAVLLLTYFLPM